MDEDENFNAVGDHEFLSCEYIDDLDWMQEANENPIFVGSSSNLALDSCQSATQNQIIEESDKGTVLLEQESSVETPENLRIEGSDLNYCINKFFEEYHSNPIQNVNVREEVVESMVVDFQIPGTSQQVTIDVEEDDLKPKYKKPLRNIMLKAEFQRKRKNSRNKMKSTSSSNSETFGEVVQMKKPSVDSESDTEIDIGTEITSMPVKKKNEFESESECDELITYDIPSGEVALEKNTYSEIETRFFADLIKDDVVNNNRHYLSLRNNIVNMWKKRKPRYLTEREVLRGFNLIDQTAVSRIYILLEQMGVINFGCTKVTYTRPLTALLESIGCESPRKRLRKLKQRFKNDGQGGCTVAYGEDGEIIDTVVINEEPVIKIKPVNKAKIPLVNCIQFPQEERFKVKLDLSALLLMDFHAHSSIKEVMGLIGGSWDSNNRTMVITQYEPCKNQAASTVHCEMCPVSQSEATGRIHDLDLNVLGWFHSHPVFPPEPSQQDLDTQREIQRWMGVDKPCVGIILSPFNSPLAVIPSEYRCLMVDWNTNQPVPVPYKFQVEVVWQQFDSKTFTSELIRIRNFILMCGSKVDFQKPYVHDGSMNNLEKFLATARLTMERYLRRHEIRQIVRVIHSLCETD